MFLTKDKKLDELLEAVHNKAVETTLKMLPDIIVGLVIKTKGINETLKAFKEANPELEGREKELADVIQAIEMENGALSLSEVLEKVPLKMKDMTIKIPEEQPHNIADVERTANGFI